MLDGPQPVRALDRAEEQRVVPVRLHRVGGDHGPFQRQRGEHRLEMADLVRLPGLGDPVLGDDQAGNVSDRRQQVHLLLPARFRALALLAVDRYRGPRGNVPGIPAHGGIKPGMGRVRPEPAVFPLLREAGRGRRLPLPPLPSFLLSCPLFRAVRSICGRDSRIQRDPGHRRRDRGLELVGVQQELPEPVQHRRRRRHPQPGPRAHPAAVRGQHVLVPALRRLRHLQRPVMPARRAAGHHRDQGHQLMPLPPVFPHIGQAPVQRPPERDRIERRSRGQMAAKAVSKPR